VPPSFGVTAAWEAAAVAVAPGASDVCGGVVGAALEQAAKTSVSVARIANDRNRDISGSS
jgi:hypothetical protein